VLKHHPDKKAGLAGHSANDDAFFKCIQKAFEVLTSPTRKAQFDSVDPYYLGLEDEVPTAAQFKSHAKSPGEARESEFFEAFAPVFEREARFSKITPVPLLGSPDATKMEVETFYDFWYNFDSWRSFEYLDKEVNEGSDKFCVGFCFLLFSSPYSFFAAEMISAIPKRRTRQNARGGKRRTRRVSARSSTSLSHWILGSNA
jgi:hypothetical protein